MSYARVLVVDDNPTNLDVAKGLLSLYGMKVDCLTGGQQAIDAVRSGEVKYNAIFMDHMMPEIDGIEAARIIREEIKTKYAQTVPIIALTANAVVGNEELFLTKGFQAFISKPIDLARLDAVVRQLIRDKDAEALLPEQRIIIGTRRGTQRRTLREDIPGVDINKGIARFGFNEDVFVNVLRSYARNTEPLLAEIKDVKEDKLNEYSVTVHGIKGSSYGIFAESAGDFAKTMEMAAKNGDYEFVKANNQRFIQTISQLVTDIDDTLAKSWKDQRPFKDKPEEALLSKLLAACDSFDIDEMDAAMAGIESYQYNSDDGLAAWLRENLDQGKYKNIKEKLTTLVKV